MNVFTLTRRYNTLVDCIRTPITVTDLFASASCACEVIWDTGATISAITKQTASALGLQPMRKAFVRGVHGCNTVNVYRVLVHLSVKGIAVKTLVTECESLSDDGKVGLLIGMDIIGLGDFCVTNFKGKTVMTFRVPSFEVVDYDAELNEFLRIKGIHETWAKQGNDECPCGSGRKYVDCHGVSKYAITK